MPGNVNEFDWERAKSIARKQGQGDNFAYIMGIYNRISKKMRADDDSVEKLIEWLETNKKEELEDAEERLKMKKEEIIELLMRVLKKKEK